MLLQHVLVAKLRFLNLFCYSCCIRNVAAFSVTLESVLKISIILIIFFLVHLFLYVHYLHCLLHFPVRGAQLPPYMLKAWKYWIR